MFLNKNNQKKAQDEKQILSDKETGTKDNEILTDKNTETKDNTTTTQVVDQADAKKEANILEVPPTPNILEEEKNNEVTEKKEGV